MDWKEPHIIERKFADGKNGNNFRLFSLFMAFLLGFCLILSLVIFTREIMVIFMGNELCVGLAFFAWFLGISIGGLISTKLLPNTENKIYIILLLQIIQSLLFPVLIYFTRGMHTFLGVPPGEMIPLSKALLGMILCLTPFSTFTGLIFPLTCSLFCEGMYSEAVGVGTVYLSQLAGIMIGGAMYTYYFMFNIPPIPLSIYLALLIITFSFFSSFFFKRDKKKHIFSLLCLVFSIYLIIGVGSGFHYFYEDASIRTRWSGLSSGTVLLQSIDTPYQNIAVTEDFGQFKVYGSGKYLFVFPEEYEAATSAHLFINQHKHPEKILVAGGGFGGLISELLKYPDTFVDYVEIEPGVIDLAKANTTHNIKKRLFSQRVKIHIVDGRHFIKVTDKKYDMVILDPAEPTSIMSNRYYTTNFYNQIKRILNKDGVLVTHIPASSLYLEDEYFPFAKSFYKTLKKVFPYICISPREKNTYLFGAITEGNVSEDIKVISDRFMNSKVRSEKFMVSLFEFLFLQDKIKRTRNTLESAGMDVPINTDLQPLAYRYSLLMWNKASKNKLSGFLDSLSSIPHYYFGSFFFILLLIVLFIQRKRSDSNRIRFLKFNVLYSSFSTGFVGAGMFMLLILIFQNFHGYIYQKIGLLVAIFTFGGIIGAFIGKRYIERTPFFPERVFFISTYIMVAVCFIVPMFFNHMNICSPFSINVTLELEYYMLVLSTSVLLGFTFPLSNFLLVFAETNIEKSSSLTETFCSGGACISFFAIIFLMPLFGIKVTSYFLGSLLLTAALSGTLWLFRYSSPNNSG